MKWNEYLYDIIESDINNSDEHLYYYILSENGKDYIKIYSSDIFKYIICFEEILLNYSGKICIVYHKFDAEFIGFVIAALKTGVKILIRRTSLEDNTEVFGDLKKIGDILPYDMVFTSDRNTEIFSNDILEELYTGVILLKNSKSSVNSNSYDFIQLSSGTTSDAKAFCLSAEGILKSAFQIMELQHTNSSSVFLSYLTMSHIYGFVSGFLLPIVSHASCVYCMTVTVKKNPEIIAELISKWSITHFSVIINTIEKVMHNPKIEYNFASVKCASLGGEKVEYSTYNRLKNQMSKYGMNPNALVNSYGMSEKGAITMENPMFGNTIFKDGNSAYVSVGNIYYDDTEIVILDDSYNILNEGELGRIGISSSCLSDFFFMEKQLKKNEFHVLNGRRYYCNGDCGFIRNGKLYITGRTINTITYNGLKIKGYILDEYIKKYFEYMEIDIQRCLCFNHPDVNNMIICYIDYGFIISEQVLNELNNRIIEKYHLAIGDFFIMSYNGKGIGKLCIPDIKKLYIDYRNNAKVK